MNRIYMDYAATTPVDDRVRKAMEPYWTEKFGNPSSIHGFGQETMEAVEIARKNVASLLHTNPSEIIFTSGGSESDNTAIKSISLALREKGNHIITSNIEHHAVYHTCEFMTSQGFDVTFMPVDSTGILDPSDVEKAITKKTVLISIMHANNEIGSLQPITEIGSIARKNGVLFHTDAVQSYGHLEIDVNKMGIDLLSLSAHKLYGPKGIGALYLRKDTPFVPFMHGGSQEQGRRSSTSNVTGIVGLGKASELAEKEMVKEHQDVKRLRDKLLDKIQNQIDGVHLNGHPTHRLPNNIHLSIDHVEGESLLMNLDLEGIAVSSGSACSAGSTEPSHVLTGLGLSLDQSKGSVRISLGKFNTEQEVDFVADTLKRVVEQLRSLSPFAGKSK
ncbi:cysteine desulfurase NifS [bacterium]